ncbi:MAG TPA: GNAT family N-acetyltransferase [Candidatus Dormibacteraeota bacterium]|nr:GNAT family N-acetyltransferase [Candidatus Dormibacteraeota bacterium]
MTARLAIKELGRDTWPDFVRVMEKHHGVWGGCWCVAFHLASGEKMESAREARTLKQRLVRAGQSHAALVYEGDDIVGWCQFGPPSELPARMGGFRKLGAAMPDWRITCFFVDRDHRQRGVARTALAGALRMIATQGGGTVDGYPVATDGTPYTGSFLWSGTESMFATAGFEPIGALGARKLVMRKTLKGRK